MSQVCFKNFTLLLSERFSIALGFEVVPHLKETISA